MDGGWGDSQHCRSKSIRLVWRNRRQNYPPLASNVQSHLCTLKYASRALYTTIPKYTNRALCNSARANTQIKTYPLRMAQKTKLPPLASNVQSHLCTLKYASRALCATIPKYTNQALCILRKRTRKKRMWGKKQGHSQTYQLSINTVTLSCNCSGDRTPTLCGGRVRGGSTTGS